jgi:tetratricopeptide (TPR) repeat protein
VIDRDRGLELLWKASKADNVHGAIATLVILQYYGNTMQFCDILPDNDQAGGYPVKQCYDVLARVRRRYPNSALWRLEQARLEAVHGRIETAVEMLGRPLQTEMRQVEALILFEKSINSMFLHRYDDAASGFLHLVTLNKWSHGLYHYFAAVCNVEAYRQSVREKDTAKVAHYSKVANELLLKVPTFMGKKRFMAQSLPLEVFADRKIKKWNQKAAATGRSLVDSVGVSPIEEMIYVWNGYKRMELVDLERSLECLKWGEDEKGEDVDEAGIRNVLKVVVLRRLGKLQEAEQLLKTVTSIEKANLKALHHDEWMGEL